MRGWPNGIKFHSDIVYHCVPKVSKGQHHAKYVCQIQSIMAAINRGKLFKSIRTLSNIYLAKFLRFLLGETKMQSINVSSALKLCIVYT